MKHLFYLLLATCLLAGCSKEEHTPLAQLASQIIISGSAEAKLEVKLTTTERWSVESFDNRYTVSPTEGGSGSNTLILTTIEENPERQSRPLSPLTIRTSSGYQITANITQRARTAPQALLFFFIGTSLQSYFSSNLKAALSAMDATTPGEGRVAAFCYQAGAWRIVELTYDYQQQKAVMTSLKEYTTLDRSQPAFLTEVIRQMQELLPAHSYGLILGGHGSGWLPSGYSLQGGGIFGLSAPQHLGLAPNGKPYPATRYFGESGSMFSIEQIAQSLTATKTRFHYLIFDDCFMSNIETLYTLRNNADYILASPCEILATGFPYHYVIPQLFQQGGTTSNLQGVCEKFHHFYLNEYDPQYPSGCIALTACEELEALAATARRIYTDSPRVLNPTQLQAYEGLSRHLFYDFRQQMEQIATNQSALEAFQLQFDRTFPAGSRLNTPSFYSKFNPYSLIPITYYSGVTCSAPSILYPTENQATSWWQATH